MRLADIRAAKLGNPTSRAMKAMAMTRPAAAEGRNKRSIRVYLLPGARYTIQKLPAEVKTLHLRVGQERRARPLEAVTAELEDIAAIGHSQRLGRVLLHDHEGVARVLHGHELVEDQRDELGREPQRRLVQEDGPGPGDEGAGG